MKSLITALIAVAAFALIEGLLYLGRYFRDRNREELKRRLQSLGQGQAGVSLLRQARLSDLPGIDALLRTFAITERLERLIEQAAVGLTVAKLLAYCVLAAMVGLAAGLVLRVGPPVAVLFGLLLGSSPILAVVYARARRSAKLSEQLPDALDMMARSLRAGHALSSSFKLVAGEMPEPINLEFGRAFEEQNLGLPFEQAIINMTKRMPGNRDLKIFGVSVIVQKETGGNLVEIIEKLAETIRGRYRFYGKLSALTAEARVSGYILGALPVLTGLTIALGNPEYMSKLVTEPLGRAFLIYASVSWVVGFFWMRRMGQVEY